MKEFCAVVILALLTCFFASAQPTVKPKLLAGPVVSSVTKNSARVWIAYRGKGQNALILGDTSDKKIYYPTKVNYINNSNGDIALTMDFTGLKPNHTYNILISIGGWGANARYSFKTQSDTAVKDFSFVLGSCALMLPNIGRIIFPGATTWIFQNMKKKKADFMLWMGDNVYYRKKDYKNFDGMFNLHVRNRKTFKKYRDFLASQPNYAIWDDHDYGPNDSGREFAMKDSSLKIFKGMWPNTYPEGSQFNGNYFNFRYYDAEFFMTDDRYFRNTSGDTAGDFLGETQIIWLKNKLLISDAAFKFIVVGSQVIGDNFFGGIYSQYPREQNDLLDFISTNNIKGVIFLTGDKHYSELSKRNRNGYPLYDFTCSPLTSPPLPKRIFGAYKNTYRVDKTIYGLRNFGKISLSGETGNRNATFEIYGRGGNKKRAITLNENELKKN